MAHTDYDSFVKIYTDGSKLQNGATGCAIFVDDISSTFSWRLDSYHSILVAELFALYQALIFSVNHFVNQDVVIFSDSLSALLMIHNTAGKNLNRLVGLIIQQIYRKLMVGGKVILQWIPSHKGIVGNEIVDQVARSACDYLNITYFPIVYKDCVKRLNAKINEARVDNFNQIKNNFAFSRSVPDITKWRWLSLDDRTFDVLMARLRSGCVDLNDYLFEIKKLDSPFYNFCRDCRETVEHFVFECERYDNQRKILFDRLRCKHVDLNTLSLSLLLTGGYGTDKNRLVIMSIFVDFVKSTKRFDL